MESGKRTAQKRKKKPAKLSMRELRVLTVLCSTALVLGVIAMVLVGTKIAEGNRAGASAAALLDAYQHKEDAAISASPASGTAAPPVGTGEGSFETPPPPDENYEHTSAEADTLAAAGAEEHRAAGADEAVNEGGVYIQPEAPESEKDLAATIEKIVNAAGDDGVVGILEIPAVDEELPIIGKWSYKLLKISICRYKGPAPNEPGNLVVIGHNYKDGSHFGRLDELEEGSELFLTDTATGTRTRYEVYQIKSISADAFSALKPYEGECGLTLMTCKDNGTNRLLLRCKQAEA